MKRVFIYALISISGIRGAAADERTNELVAVQAVGIEVLVEQALRENPELQFFRAEIVAAESRKKVGWAVSQS